MSPAGPSLSGRQPKAVQTALQVLEEIARGGAGITAKDISERLDIPSATVYRLLNLLVADEYVVRMPDLAGFALGPRTGALVDATLVPRVCAAARDVLAELRLSIRFGAHLYYFTNTSVRAADVDTEFPPTADEPTINRYLHASAVGKLLLAEKSELDEWVHFPLTALTGRTPTTRDALEQQLSAITRDGYATQVGELDPDRACVAVGVRSRSGVLVAALALSGTADRCELMGRQIPSLVDYAQRLGPFLA
ncbi:IclR family transcriptional regulator [Gordonia rhizosphera]|uniref:Putative IclR family transcriptional regulator n=1 Tax=Gordonia rhizosphera NBRC 16068 TaxID=1108045 RepID=K6WI78_9ACTN|nr:IclR family transcriptional regulator C-terminal domain-containing protein [Gordonia rhizosphera]GAB91837.1 putative IclR family transcriptional regulator [Gordonia rhizosphera NBRC 16068]